MRWDCAGIAPGVLRLPSRILSSQWGDLGDLVGDWEAWRGRGGTGHWWGCRARREPGRF
jgi:hypothetical protein